MYEVKEFIKNIIKTLIEALRGLFSTEFLFRCFVGLQGLFIVIWIALADDYVRGSDWYFMFQKWNTMSPMKDSGG